jgi:hypothetical protein
MEYDDLTCAQAEKLLETIGDQLNFYGRLRKRAGKRGRTGWNGDFSKHVENAFNAVHRLRVHLHYASIPNGVYSPTKVDDRKKPPV